ncbi:hypothetical protein MNEG_14979 [Monoraphidium neglectum]|uniref:Uncharacterized protein n=1 Tax=Monoraphidium neglectum TaxID=145388 RepID=A0A0D2LME5_9CHLO|nr:hypothetical protein MNEG_14979 [Monoraphidium neglectum]KIY92984.1 hypothetical protein MNEG_14979 [Monoraphidium neglectum]|eukprot:XP_013892004.1 hypothetical protein MNEG_14979 [Monoraphidium neglectum]
MASHALCRLMEHGGRAARGAMRRRLAAACPGASEEDVDAAADAGRLDWLLLSRAAAAAAARGRARAGASACCGGGGESDHDAELAAVEAMPRSALDGLLRLVSPKDCACAGSHRWVNAAAVGLAARWVGAAAAEGAGGAGAGGEARARRARAKLAGSFLAVGGCWRLAALLDDCVDEADKAPTFQSRDSQRSHKRGVAAQALQLAGQLLHWCDELRPPSPPAHQPPRAPPASPSRHARAVGPPSAGASPAAAKAPVGPEPAHLWALSSAALALAGDWLSWVCVSSIEALGADGAAAAGRAVSELCERAHATAGAPALSDLDPCWRAVRVLGDERTGVAAQLLGAHVVCSYPAVVRLAC